MRNIPPNKFINKGKQLSDIEIDNIRNDYRNYLLTGSTKKSIIEKLSDKYGRGYWSILKVIDNTETKIHLFDNKESTLFAVDK